MNHLVNELTVSGRPVALLRGLFFFCFVGHVCDLCASGSDTPYKDQVMVALKVGLPAYGDRKAPDAGVFNIPSINGDSSILHFDQRSTEVSPKVVVLSRLVVSEARFGKAQTISSVVRIPEQKAIKNVVIDPFASEKTRNAQLVEKHLSVFDRKVLNRITLPLFGVSNIARAKQAEAIANSAHQMNTFANAIELTAAEGEREEAKKLREEYYRLFLTRPK